MALKCNLIGHKFSQRWIDGKDYGLCSCGEKFRLYSGEDFTKECEKSKWEHSFWESDAWAISKNIALILLICCAVLAMIILQVMWTDKATCMSYKNLGIPTQWGFWTSCMAKHPQYGWIPVDKYFEILNLYVNP